MPFRTVTFNDPSFAIPPVRYSPVLQATGMTFTGSGSTYPTYNSYYVKHGYMVTFWIEANLSTVTDFGTGQYQLELPYAPHNSSMNHFNGWVWYDPLAEPNPDLADHIVLNVDHMPGSSTLDLHWLGADSANPKPVREHVFTATSPFSLNVRSKIYVNGTYFTDTL